MSGYGMSVRIDATIEEALERTRAALAEQGFGILTEIDVAATLKAKLDLDVRRRSSWVPATRRWPAKAYRSSPTSGCCSLATSWSAPTSSPARL